MRRPISNAISQLSSVRTRGERDTSGNTFPKTSSPWRDDTHPSTATVAGHAQPLDLDGDELFPRAVEGTRGRRKNRRSPGRTPSCAPGVGDGAGVDINRNYNFLWDSPPDSNRPHR